MSALSHAQIWGAIDALASRLSLSPSSLARLAGLDATSFNRSKRLSKDRPPRPRWPSTESLAKLITAAGISFAEFAALADGGQGEAPCHVPLMGLAEASQSDPFDLTGHPIGTGWALDGLPGFTEAGTYSLQIKGQDFEPVYRDGSRIIVHPGLKAQPGDRVVVKVQSGELLVRQLVEVTEQVLVLSLLQSPQKTCHFTPHEVVWLSPIVWASQ